MTASADPLESARATAVPNRVLDNLHNGVLSHAFSLKLVANIEVVHYAAAAGYDAVLIDLEHSSFGLETANQLSCAALQVG